MIWSIGMYLVIGGIVSLICASGGGRASVDIELLGKEINKRWVMGILLANVVLFWPAVLWLMIAGRKADGSAAS